MRKLYFYMAFLILAVTATSCVYTYGAASMVDTIASRFDGGSVETITGMLGEPDWTSTDGHDGKVMAYHVKNGMREAGYYYGYIQDGEWLKMASYLLFYVDGDGVCYRTAGNTVRKVM